MQAGLLVFGKYSLFIDAPTRIGRSQVPFSYSHRHMPIDISGVNNQLIIPSDSVSRNHALVWPELNEDQEIIRFLIQDLRSVHGTRIVRNSHEFNISSESPTELISGDIIHIGPASIVFVLQNKVLSRHAILIATDPDNTLKGIERDLNDMHAVLLEVGFSRENIRILSGPQVTRAHVWELLADVQKHAVKESLFVFYYSGHGTRDGKLFINPPGWELTPEALHTAFTRISGNRIMILDSCFAKKFIGVGTIENCAFLGASQEDEKAYERAKEGGIFTQAVVRAIRLSLSKYNNYVYVDKLDIEGCRTRFKVGEQNFTMPGNISFTGR